MKKISIVGNYIVVTNSDSSIVLFEAPQASTKYINNNGNVKIYHETATDNYRFIDVELENLKDSSGNELSGGALSWLRTNTSNKIV